MLNLKIEEGVEKAQTKKDEEVANGNNNFQGEKEHDIRQRNVNRLHEQKRMKQSTKESTD